MRDIWILTKVQLLGFFDINRTLHSKNRRDHVKLVFTGLLLLYALVVIFVVSYFYSRMLADALNPLGLLELMPAQMMAAASIVTLITTIYKTNGTLFAYRDYDMIFSLPVKNSHVVVSRILLLYVYNLLFIMILLLPTGAVYGSEAGQPMVFYPLYLLMCLFVPILPMILASLIGTAVSFVAVRFRHKNTVNTILTLILVLVVMGFSMTANQMQSQILSLSVTMAKMINRIYPLAGLFSTAVCQMNSLSMLLFGVGSLAALFLFAKLLGSRYREINSALTASGTRNNYRLGQLKAASPLSALYRKELRRFLGTPIYVVNSGFAALLLVVAALLLLFFGQEQLAAFLKIPQFGPFITNLVPFAAAIFITMVNITACAISLEGKNLWILQSAPLHPKTIFHSKIAVSLTVTLPAILIGSTLLAISLRPNLATLLFLFLTPMVYAVFTAILGLVLNLRFPNLVWTSEMTVVKQSVASFLSVILGMVTGIAPMVLSVLRPTWNGFPMLAATTIVIAILSMVLYHNLCTKGAEQFRRLAN